MDSPKLKRLAILTGNFPIGALLEGMGPPLDPGGYAYSHRRRSRSPTQGDRDHDPFKDGVRSAAERIFTGAQEKDG